jgi:hypothetical protein
MPFQCKQTVRYSFNLSSNFNRLTSDAIGKWLLSIHITDVDVILTRRTEAGRLPADGRLHDAILCDAGGTAICGRPRDHKPPGSGPRAACGAARPPCRPAAHAVNCGFVVRWKDELSFARQTEQDYIVSDLWA